MKLVAPKSAAMATAITTKKPMVSPTHWRRAGRTPMRMVVASEHRLAGPGVMA